MNRREFMEQLSRLLSDIPEQEREEALEYYESYFDDAGEEKEDAVIRELGSPGKVAAIIKADLKQSDEEYASYTDRGYEDNRFDEDRQMPQSRGSGERRNRQERSGKRSAGMLVLLIILAIFTFPFWGGLGAACLGVIMGIVGMILGVFAGSFFGGIGLIIGGIALFVVGLFNIVSSVPIGLALLGVGMILLAIGILLWMLFYFLAFCLLPRGLRFLTDRLHLILHKRKGESTL